MTFLRKKSFHQKAFIKDFLTWGFKMLERQSAHDETYQLTSRAGPVRIASSHVFALEG